MIFKYQLSAILMTHQIRNKHYEILKRLFTSYLVIEINNKITNTVENV